MVSQMPFLLWGTYLSPLESVPQLYVPLYSNISLLGNGTGLYGPVAFYLAPKQVKNVGHVKITH